MTWGFVAGHPDRRVIGCATFAFSAARVNRSSTVSTARNIAPRSIARATTRCAACPWRQIQGLNLQSYLFFGSANRLYQHVKQLLQRRPECRYLLFDFKLVTGIDSSAAYSFAQIKRSARDLGIELILVHLPAAAEKVLRSSDFVARGVTISPSSIARWNGARTS